MPGYHLRSLRWWDRRLLQILHLQASLLLLPLILSLYARQQHLLLLLDRSLVGRGVGELSADFFLLALELRHFLYIKRQYHN